MIIFIRYFFKISFHPENTVLHYNISENNIIIMNEVKTFC